MKAATIDAFGAIDEIQLRDVASPRPKPGEVLVQCSHAGINPVDIKICHGHLAQRIPHEFPLILGWEGAGTIVDIGEGVDRSRIGEEVLMFVRASTIRWGTFCEYTVFPSQYVIPKPSNLSLAEASTVSLTALTAWQTLVDFLSLKEGQSILIHGGGGGLGTFAIQLAKHLGSRVYTTVSQSKRDYASHLGADVLIDYQSASFLEQVRAHEPQGVDAVLDTVGGETLEASYDVVRPGGRLVSVASRSVLDQNRNDDITSGFVSVQPNGVQLQAIVQLFEKGYLRTPHLRLFPLSQVITALDEVQQGHTMGKVALSIS